jgi:DNA-binding NarL/FixJ family response regulator
MSVRRRTSGVAANSGELPESVRRVVLAVPDAAAAGRLQRSLEGAGFDVSAQASAATEAVAVVARHRPSLCLFASELAGEEFLPIQEIARTSPGTCVVVLARFADAEEMAGVLRAGAAGYVPATRTGKKLIEPTSRSVSGMSSFSVRPIAELWAGRAGSPPPFTPFPQDFPAGL